MRISIYFCMLTVLLFFLVGILFHSSPNPILLGKYSVRHIGMILAVIFAIAFLHKFVGALFSQTEIHLGKIKFRLTPSLKWTAIATVLIALFAQVEISERKKNIEAAQSMGKSFLRGYHPFLQNRLGYRGFNSHEFRGKEIDLVKPAGTYRIFLLGGSTVLSGRVEQAKTHAAILENQLNSASHLKFEVMNAGNHWHTTQHSLIKYLFRIKDFEPDMIVLWHAVNDILRSCPEGDYQHGTYRSDYVHYYGPISNMVFQYANNPPQKLGPFIDLNIASLPFIRKKMQSYLFSDLRKKRESFSIPQAYEYIPVDIDKFVSHAAFERNLKSIVNTLKADGVKLVLGTQAHLYKNNMSKEENSKSWMRNFCQLDGKKHPDTQTMLKVMNQFNDTTRRVAKNYRVGLIDLEKQVPKDLKYFVDDVHYSEEGNALIGNVLFEELRPHLPVALKAVNSPKS